MNTTIVICYLQRDVHPQKLVEFGACIFRISHREADIFLEFYDGYQSHERCLDFMRVDHLKSPSKFSVKVGDDRKSDDGVWQVVDVFGQVQVLIDTILGQTEGLDVRLANSMISWLA